MLDQVIKFFIVFFVVVEPVSLLPLFVSLTEGANAAYCRRMARKAVILSGAILFLFVLAGAVFLEAMGISLEAFRIFGGLLLLLIALEMVFARESGRAHLEPGGCRESPQRPTSRCFRWRFRSSRTGGARDDPALVRPGVDHAGTWALGGAVRRSACRSPARLALHAARRTADAGDRGHGRERVEPPARRDPRALAAS